MKIRTGFVSNSSSSSFLIFGTHFSECVKAAKLLKASGYWPSKFEYSDPNDDDDAIFEALEKLQSNREFKGLTVEWGEDGLWVGTSWDKVKDDETGKQFKERVEATIEKLFGKKLKCKTYNETVEC